jgi:transcriptional regulator with PAS, ATPase and Fis domain
VAIKDKAGGFQLADKGSSIFLDEIGDISPAIQLKLLCFLQEHTFERVGDSKSIKAYFRTIAATNFNLKQKVKSGKFRKYLYYRLNVIEVKIPALRERLEDIPLFTEYFLKHFKKNFKRNIKGISDLENYIKIEYLKKLTFF